MRATHEEAILVLLEKFISAMRYQKNKLDQDSSYGELKVLRAYFSVFTQALKHRDFYGLTGIMITEGKEYPSYKLVNEIIDLYGQMMIGETEDTEEE